MRLRQADQGPHAEPEGHAILGQRVLTQIEGDTGEVGRAGR